MPDLTLRMIGSDLASSAIKGVAGNIAGMAGAVRDFANSALHDFTKSQQAITQLRRVTGDTADQFVEIASEMQRTLGVSDDMVIGMMTLTRTFGAAEAQLEPTTRAILDFSAATGKDAKSSLEQLLRGVETGNGELKKLGINFESTGDKTKDLALATEALAAKYGGAAGADSKTLAGQIRIAEEALNDLKKGFGGLIAEGLQATGVVDQFNKSLAELTYLVGSEKKDLDEVNQRTEVQIALLKERKMLTDALAQGIGKTRGGDGMTADQVRLRVVEIDMRLKALDLMKQEREEKMKGAPLSTEGTHELTAAARNAAQEAEKESASKHAQDMKEAAAAHAKAMAESAAEYEKEGAQRLEEIRAAAAAEGAEALAQVHIAQRLAMAEQYAAIEKSEEEFWTDFGRTTARGVREAREGQQVREELDKTEEMFADAGMQIGLALANEITSAMEEMLSGGEVDAGEVFGDIVATILAVAGTAIGAVVGNAGGAAVGGAIGSLAGSAVRSATRRRKRHDGGWSDAEQYHSGGWPGLSSEEIPAVLQAGERVLSRQEVGRMGGRAGVDAAARGGGSQVTINLPSAIDAKGIRDAFSGEAGRGWFESIQSGRGDLARLFGMDLVY